MRRENTPLQVAVIILVAVVAILAVATHYWFSRAHEYTHRALAAERELAQARTQGVELKNEAERLRTLIGHSPATSLSEIERAHTKDVASVQGEPGLEQPAYRRLVWTMLTAARSATQRELMQRDEIVAARAAVDATRAELERTLAVQQRAYHDLERTANERQKAALAQQQQMFAAAEKMQRDLFAKLDEIAAWQGRYHKLERTAQAELAGEKRRYDTLREHWENVAPLDFEHPYGQIVEIDYPRRLAYINLGHVDQLPNGLVLGVYAADGSRSEKTKGRVEVTRVLGEHTATVHIVEESLRDPLLRGDVLYTPLWQPGQLRHFALAGEFDLNGDGRSDAALIRQMVRSAGGEIDAELSPDGDQQGQLLVTTRYLIVGQEPRGTRGSRATTAYGAFIAQAQSLGIDLVSADKFLSAAGRQRSPTGISRASLLDE